MNRTLIPKGQRRVAAALIIVLSLAFMWGISQADIRISAAALAGVLALIGMLVVDRRRFKASAGRQFRRS